MNDTSQQQPEKRITKRVVPAPDQPVHVTIEGPGFSEVATAVNVSKDGMGISVPRGFEGCNLDDNIVILVKLPEPANHSFSTAAKVVYHQDTNVGVQFENLVKEDEDILSGYIEHRLVNTDGASLMRMLYGG